MTDKSHLLRFGYAPGNYWFVCRDCGNKHAAGDKRAIRCEPCAESLHAQITSVEAVADKQRAMTTLPQEAVKAAADAAHEELMLMAKQMNVPMEYTQSISVNNYRVMRAALTAALPFLPVQGAVKVKSLDWGKSSVGEQDKAQTVVGSYFISNHAVDAHNLMFDNDKITALLSVHTSLEAAKAAAQADYEARILSALEPSAGRAAVLEEGYRQGIEAAAQIIETKQEGFQVRGGGRVLIDRSEGDQSGLGYAAAIRALASHPVADKPDEAGAQGEVTAAARDVLAERRRQMDAEGWTPEHDDGHRDFSIPRAAATYAYGAGVGVENRSVMDGHGNSGSIPILKMIWPMSWGWGWYKPKNRRADLVKAGALILAEIERLDRLPSAPSEGAE